MTASESSKPAAKEVIVLMLVALIAGLFALPAYAHGPKGHGGQSFTALEAAKKGITLYDKLVARGKLDETWETGLTEIKVLSRSKNNSKEFVVQFERLEGEPRSVYIFFDAKGEYSGSNFTGE